MPVKWRAFHRNRPCRCRTRKAVRQTGPAAKLHPNQNRGLTVLYRLLKIGRESERESTVYCVLRPPPSQSISSIREARPSRRSDEDPTANPDVHDDHGHSAERTQESVPFSDLWSWHNARCRRRVIGRGRSTERLHTLFSGDLMRRQTEKERWFVGR